jgi:hypothetical protein
VQAAQKAHVEMTKKMRQNLEKDMAVEEEEYGKAAAAKGAGMFAGLLRLLGLLGWGVKGVGDPRWGCCRHLWLMKRLPQRT